MTERFPDLPTSRHSPSPAEARAELRQMIEEEEVIVVGAKTRLTIVAALDDVRRQAGDLKAFVPWHESDPGT
jgi:hypothetical protein